MQEKHPLETAADCVGGQNRLAEILGVSTQAIGNWKQRGVPIERCVDIENAAGGIVTRRNLRPDDWQAIWPELVAQTFTRSNGEVVTDQRKG